MKHLKVEVNGMEWVNGDFAEISFTDGPGGVRIEGKPTRAPAAPRNGGGLLDLITQASRSRTQAAAEEKRAELVAATEVGGTGETETEPVETT